MERITDDTIDISEQTNFDYYDICQCWYKQYSEENPRIDRWLDVYHRVGSALCYWILTTEGKVIARTTVQHFTNDEATSNVFQTGIGHYHKCLDQAFGKGDHYDRNLDGLEGFTYDNLPNPYKTYEKSYNGPNAMLNVNDYVKMPRTHNYQQIHMTLILVQS